MTRHREARLGREERKERTRQRLLDAAVELMGEDGNLTGLSLRRVARRAHITPAAFYRHFESMEELGLSLLDGVGPTLRRLLREVRRARELSGPELIARSVDVYVKFVLEHRPAFTLIVRERAGGAPRIRQAIRRDMGYFAQELAGDLPGLLPPGMGLSPARALSAAELIIELMLGTATDILDAAGDVSAQSQQARFVDHLAMILVGALTLDGQKLGSRRAAGEGEGSALG